MNRQPISRNGRIVRMHVIAGLLISVLGGQVRAAGFVIKDAWVAEALEKELAKAVESGRYKGLAQQAEQAILARLCCGRVDKPQALVDMVLVLRGARYLPPAGPVGPMAKGRSDNKLGKWLMEHEEVRRLLFRGMADTERTRDAMARLAELVKAEEQKVLAYPQLAVAFATSEPYSRTPEDQQASTLDAFRYYTGKQRFRYNLKTMPYEISRYLADTRLSLAERQWAMRNYGRHPNPAKAFFDVKYDDDHYKKGLPKKISRLPFLLPNLRKVGGVCAEQAYFAAEVCKAVGVPAAYVSGKGGTGQGHAWTACLKWTGKRAVWDSSTGRYREHLYYIGEVRNPAAGDRIKDCELMLTSLAAQLPLERREQADALAEAARIVHKAMGNQEPDVSILQKLAETYNGTAGKPPGRKADTRWIRPARKPDGAVIEELLSEVFERNLVHTQAWELLVKLCRSGELSTAQVVRLLDVLVKRTAATHPDYSYDLVMRIAPSIENQKERRKLYDRVLAVYRARPDLQGRVLLVVGDDYVDTGDKARALKAYDAAAIRCSNIADVVVAAARRAEDLYIQAGKTQLAIQMYTRLVNRAPRVKSAFLEQTARYQLGMRLVKLLEANGKEDAARRIRTQIEAKPSRKRTR